MGRNTSFVIIGLLGPFTFAIFSTFGNETLGLIRTGRMDMSALNAGLQVAVGLFMVWLGRALALGIWR